MNPLDLPEALLRALGERFLPGRSGYFEPISEMHGMASNRAWKTHGPLLEQLKQFPEATARIERNRPMEFWDPKRYYDATNLQPSAYSTKTSMEEELSKLGWSDGVAYGKAPAYQQSEAARRMERVDPLIQQYLDSRASGSIHNDALDEIFATLENDPTAGQRMYNAFNFYDGNRSAPEEVKSKLWALLLALGGTGLAAQGAPDAPSA